MSPEPSDSPPEPSREAPPPRAPAGALRVALVRPSHLGDIVCALPVYHALRDALPDARIAWVVQPEFSVLVAGLPGIDRVLRFERERGLGAWSRLRRDLRGFRPDAVIDAQGNAKSAAAVLVSGAPRRIGLARSDWREALGALTVREPAPPAPAGAHAVERMLALARHAVRALAGPDAEVPAPRFDPGLSADELRAGRALADRRLPRGDGAPVIVHLAAPNDVRAWPTAQYRALALELLARGRGVLLLSGPGEAPVGKALRAELGARPGLAHWIGQAHLREAAAFFAAAAERGARLVSCDSGPMHLAAACGLPVVALCGPQDPALTGPWPLPDRAGARAAGAPRHVVVRADDPPDCAPCLARSCSHREGPVCMSELHPLRVARALEA